MGHAKSWWVKSSLPHRTVFNMKPLVTQAFLAGCHCTKVQQSKADSIYYSFNGGKQRRLRQCMVFTVSHSTRSQKRTLNLQQAGTIPAKGDRPRAQYCGCPARGSRDPFLINTSGKFGGRSNKPSSQIAASFDSELPVKPNTEDFMVIGVLRSFLIIGITTRTTKFKQTEAEGWK